MRSKERIRARKKQKRLDAICEKVYNSNRLIGGFGNDESNEGSNVGGGLGSEEKEVRRSSRVRKAPVFLDASPSPLRKKQRVDNGGGSLSGKNEGSRKGGDQFEKDSGDGEEKVGWKSRLRSRAHDVGFEMRGTWTSPRRKKINFDDSDVSKEELKVAGREMGAKKEGGEGVEVVEVVKSPPLARSKKGVHSKGKRSLGPKVGDQSIEVAGSNKEGNNDNVGERLLALDEEDKSHLKSSVGDGREGLVANDEEGRTMDGLRLDEEQTVGRDVEALEQRDEQMEQAECEKEGVACMEEVGHPINEVGNEGSTAGKDACPAKPGRKSLEDDVVVKVDRLKQMSTEKPDRLRIGEGRRCGLCGRGTDGKPPKRLVKDFGDSDNEAYGGSSSSEEANYDKWDGFGDEPDWLGRLLGPIHDRFGIADVWVHQHCAVWSPEVYFAGPRCLKNVRAALFRGRALKCSRCGRPGATIGCRVDRCPKTYHLPCGRADGCVFDHRKFLIACVDHRHLFQPQGHHYLHRIKKLKAKKLKLEMKKLSHDAWRKDYEAEEKWLENNGEDEEFLRREGKRLHRDILRIAPVYIGGSSADNEKLYQGWESVAGLQDVIQCMKEVVLLPLLYPEFFSSLGLTPPRGVLLHGYPGTGKTLVVRALIGSCARGDRRIAYFARKGADCLGKYVGDAERQLRLLFQVAEKSQPSIIFFDEIDGLAPCRTRQQDQTHNSVVSTLLALMDGLKSRGSVVVIGATNRPDAVDPALRRPGRFDREIYFPLPSVKDRAAILSVHTQRWPKPVSGALLKLVAQKTAGFAGADLQALCTQAAMIALKRNCAWQELMSVAEKKANKGRLLPVFSFPVEEKDWLDALACAPPPCSRREAGMAANDVVSSPLHLHLVHCLLEPLSHLLISLYRDERILLPPLLYKAAKLIRSTIISALEQKGRSNDFWWAFLSDLIKEADIARQIERCLFTAGLLTGASVSGNLDAKNDDTDACNEFELQKVNRATAPTRLKNGLHLSGRTLGFRVLITGHPKSGQRHLASCLLYGFVGCVEIQKVDLATISQEGHGDVTDGMTQILLKCLSKDLCVIYMPRIDLWAMEVLDQVDDRENYACESTCKSADTAGPYDSTRHASQLWNSFMEQVDAMNLSASLMILATSEVPSQDLPQRIGQFFTRDVLNFNDSSSSVHTIPRFLVQATGEIDYDTVISSSAVELSHNLVQQYVQLLHNRLHATNTLEECKPDDAIESNAETESHNNCAVIDMTDGVNLRTNSNGDACCNGDKSHQVTNGNDQSVPISNAVGNQDEEVRLCNSRDAVPRIQPNNRTIKGKSSLLLAISSFGYQILRYPHFSELCWATSKLKQGPCTDINGPWKGWPFNSCIIRPNSSLEKVAPGWSSGNLKSKEHSGLVRGLIAVGLLAYRGVYKSVREVSFEVRKVLELLVEQVSAKILDGKDRISFLRLLSQVAYLEDMVNSWAYTLQSLEQDSQMAFSNPRQTIAGDPDSCHTSVPDQVGTGAVNPNVSQENSIEVQVQEQCPPIVSADGGLELPNSEESIIISEEPFRDMVSLAHSAPGSILQVSKSSMLPVSNERTLNTQKSVTNAESRISKDHISVGVLNGGSRSSEQLNGVAKEGSILPSVAGLHLHNDLNVVTNSNSRKGSGQCNNLSKSPSSEDCTRDADQLGRTVNVTLNKNSSVSAVPKETCVYGCCCECLHSIYVLIKKILIHERQVSGSCSTVEDVHDVVASSSANLLSAVRGFSNVPSVSSSEFVDKKLRGENLGKVCACPDVGHVKLKRTSYHESSVDRVVVPLECSFHSESKCVNQSRSLGEKANACTNSLSGLGFNFFFRDNVLIRSEVDKDVLFHCQFEKLCLGALIEWISMIKQPLD